MERVVSVVMCTALAGCASGTSPASGDAQMPVDGPVSIDAPPVIVDAPPVIVDAPPVLPDAPPTPDAPPDACVPVTTELLVNPAFDLSPVGTGWIEIPIDPAYPLVTSDGPEHSPPYAAWLGGFEALFSTVTDQLYQDVVVPPGTTQLVFTGYYLVGSDESTSTNVYDTAQVALTQPNGTPIVTVISLSNLTVTSNWTPINFTVPMDLSGQTVRVRFTSTNDYSYATSFLFDTLSLRATHCP
jgi:hypothetical protein